MFTPNELTTLPYSLSKRVFPISQKNEGNYVIFYEYFRDYYISFPLTDFESDLLLLFSVVPS